MLLYGHQFNKIMPPQKGAKYFPTVKLCGISAPNSVVKYKQNFGEMPNSGTHTRGTDLLWWFLKLITQIKQTCHGKLTLHYRSSPYYRLATWLFRLQCRLTYPHPTCDCRNSNTRKTYKRRPGSMTSTIKTA